MAVNTGKYEAQNFSRDDEFGYRQSRENDEIDSKYGFDRVKDQKERTGFLMNMHSTEVLDEDRKLVSALDMYFMQMDGARYKVSVVYQPYLLVKTLDKHALEVSRFLIKKYSGQVLKIEPIEKEDLELHNHLMGLKQTYLKLWFPNITVLTKVRKELLQVVKKNQEREKSNTYYIQSLKSTLAGNDEESSVKYLDHMDNIIDIREHDVPYHVRVSIDLKIFCGSWYTVRCRGRTETPIITARPDIIERPEPVVFAFDIETTKLPLKFPDAQTDQIMMISYMIDSQGYLITNREIISSDVDDFEYTPKPEFEGNFIIFNEQNEKELIQKFFDHILDVKPHIFVTYNGDFFDWAFVETRAAIHDMDMKKEIGFAKGRDGVYLCRPAMHMDCLCWVKRDSYLPVGSQGLKAVAKAKLNYNPVELDPEEMCKMAIEDPQVLSNYSVSDAVATYYLYMKYVHPFIFALCTIIPMEPDEVLRKGSGTLCETLLMVQAFHANIIFPNKQQSELNPFTSDGHVLDTETYVGGHVEALESGVFRADLPCRFRLDSTAFDELLGSVERTLEHAIVVEEGVPLDKVTNLEDISLEIKSALISLRDAPNRFEQPVIYHLDVGAMYPNIILTNRLQPSAMVNEETCAACDFNRHDAPCKRNMEWLWRGEFLPASRGEFQRIQQQLETERFPALFPGGPMRAFHQLSREDQAAYEKKRLSDYCRKAYKKTKVTRTETRTSTVCQKENSFYVDTVRAFRDRRYEYKGLTKKSKAEVSKAIASGDAIEIKAAKGREILYDSLQLAHKCILNSFYGYVMRRGARWHSMQMGGIVCLTGSNIIRKAREIIERVGRPLELDTDGIWCVLPATFPQNYEVISLHEKKKKFTVSFPNAVLNMMVKDHFTNDQYHELESPPGANGPDSKPVYTRRSENSIFFEVDGPYLAMVLPASKEEGKKLKKRYAVFNFDGSLAELKGFEIKRRGELQLIKIFQSSVFEAFLQGSSIEECYASVAKVADYWLDVLYSKGTNMPDSELFELISENRSMSRKLEDYGAQKSTSISTAKRLAEFLGDQMVKDAGLACKFIISCKPEGAPVTERAIPLAIFQSEMTVRRHYLRKWLRDNTMGDADIRQVLDWNYYIERLGGAIQKIITIPAALQGLANPVPRVQHPDWLHRKMLEKNDVLKQRRINELFKSTPKPVSNDNSESIGDIEDIAGSSSTGPGVPLSTTRKRQRSNEDEDQNAAPTTVHKTWKEALGAPPAYGTTRKEQIAWIRFQKKKWEWQWQQRRGDTRTAKRQRSENNRANSVIQSTTIARTSVTIGGFLRKAQKNLLDSPWQIIQIGRSAEAGVYRLWALIGNELHHIRLNVPRIFYVNQMTPAPPEEAMWKKVHRVLPRARPIYNLYRYSVTETVFRENSLGLLADLAAPTIEGIYETQMAPEFRVLLDLGCICCVERNEAKRLSMTSSSTNTFDSFNLEQLQTYKTNDLKSSYLDTSQNNLKKIFFYQHSVPSSKREMWALFMNASKRALIVVVDSVKTNQMPNMNSLYSSEKMAKINNDPDCEKSLPPDDITFEIKFETDVKQVYKLIQRALIIYKEEKKGPTLLAVQSVLGLEKLNGLMPGLMEFPQTQVHIVDTGSLLAGLDWQRFGARAIVRHYLNLNTVLELMLEQCRYFRVPIGNMPPDPVLFGADLFFARHLQKHNFVLWCSSTGRPDLGGRESDDSRLLSEFEDSKTALRNKQGLYTSVCVELSVDSLAVSALLQANKIQETEGAVSGMTFDTIPQASLEDMIAPSTNSLMLQSYDDTALCSAAFKVMRSMVNSWLRDVTINRNVFADFQVVHFYRWIQSSRALLYDPALRRALNNLMKKLFLQLVAEFQRLGADIVYADFNKIIICTGKKLVPDAIGYVDFVVQSIRNKELFHSIDLSYQQCWDFLLWMDAANYAGVRGKLPRGLTDDTEIGANGDDEEDGQEDQQDLDMNWNIGEGLPEDLNCRDHFEMIMLKYMEALAIIIKEPLDITSSHNTSESTPSVSSAISSLSHMAYAAAQKMHKLRLKKENMTSNPALEYVKAVHKVLSIDTRAEEEVETLHHNMLRLIGVGDFSDRAVWKDPCDSFVLREVICKACNHCRDVDLCRDKHRAMKDNVPVWLCAQCLVGYNTEQIEMRLLDMFQRKVMSYALQDLICSKCREIKRENLAKHCSCAGEFQSLLSRTDMEKCMNTLKRIAIDYKMELLLETVDKF